MADLKLEFIKDEEKLSGDTQEPKPTLSARPENEYNEIERIIKFRMLKRIKSFEKDICEILGDSFEFAIAGNSLNKDIPNDYDLYALGEFEFDLEKIKCYNDIVIKILQKLLRIVLKLLLRLVCCHYMLILLC